MQVAALADLPVANLQGLADLHGVSRASDLTGESAGRGTDRLLPVSEQFKTLLPGYGLRRGSVVGVTGSVPGTTSLLLALLSTASRSGSWCAMVGMPTMGFVAAAESGIVLERLAVVPNPGPDWPNVVAALIDGFDLVVIGAARLNRSSGGDPGNGFGNRSGGGGRIAASVCAQMAARARRRGSVLVPFGAGWDGAEVTLSLVDSAWDGVGEGAGRRVAILAKGRGAASIGRKAEMFLPAPVPALAPNASTHFRPYATESATNAGPARAHLHAIS